jgi:CubicO group peptidase (beta-lactamase class C family)
MVALTGTASAQTSPASTALDASLKAAVERKDIPGVVALVTDKKGVIYEGAFGVADVSSGRALKTDALFRIASMTKPVTSVALMQLVEQGKISLDDPAEKYLPELKNPRSSRPSTPRPATTSCARRPSPQRCGIS